MERIVDMDKIKNIEFLRVIGCLAVVFFHLFRNKIFLETFTDVHWVYRLSKVDHGYLAVELFFILSGIFFVLTLNTKLSLWEFVKKKLIRLYPVLVFVMLGYFLISLTGINEFEFKLYDNILCLLSLNGTGLVLERGRGNLGVFWYVSSMLWVLIPLFYSLKYFDKKVVNIILLGLVFLSYTFLVHADTGGYLRAIGGIGIGYFIGEWYKNNKDMIENCVLSVKCRLFLTIIEFMCLFFIINNLFIRPMKYRNDMIFIAVFTIITVCFLFNKGYISKVLDNISWTYISKYTYSIYMTHIFVLWIISHTIWKSGLPIIQMHPVLNTAGILALIAAFGIFTYHFVEVPAKAYFNKKMPEGKAR